MKHPIRLRPPLLALLAILWRLAACAQTDTKAPGLDFEPNLPVIFLEVTNPIVAEPRVPCVARCVYPKGTVGGPAGLLQGSVRIHGATSQGHPKKSYGWTLGQPESLLGLRTNAHWILQAAYIDRSLMRHKLSYDLFRSLAPGATNRAAAPSRFVELYLNGQYNGAYLLMERVDRHLLHLRSYSSNETVHSCIYKAVDHAANFAQTGHDGYAQTEPEPTLRPYWQPLEEFNRFVARAEPAAFFHSQTGIVARLDLDNAIDFHLLVLLTSNSDGITKNYFFARNGQATGPATNRFFFVPWDYDATFGRCWEASRYPHDVWLSNHLFDRLLADPSYRDKFTARWNQLRDREFSAKTIQAMIDDAVQTLGPAARRNAARWPTNAGGYPDALTFTEDVGQMKAWIEARIRWLDQEINHHLDQHHE